MIFGGHYYEGEQKGYIYLNDTYVLDVNANKFTVTKNIFRNLRHQEQLLLQDMLIVLSLLDPKLLFLEAKDRNKSLEIFMR